MYRFLYLISVLVIITSLPANAGNVGDSMSEFWNDMGGTSNVTPGGNYNGQAGGYYSLGNVFARTKVKNKNFASLQMPSHRAGCGGIDMFAGSFSYINADELISLFNAIASNAGAFAFKLGLETLSPQIAEQISELQRIIQQMNEFQINSCEQAASLVGGLWPKQDEASRSICASIGNRRGLFSDQAAAKHGCSAGGKRSATLNNSQDGEFENIKVTNINMAWKAIRDSGLLGKGGSFDREMAELFMTLSGTIIIAAGENDDSPGDYRHISGKIDSSKVIGTLLDGGTIEIIHCDEIEKCLNPSINIQTHTLAEDKAFAARVEKILKGLSQKIASEANGNNTQALSAEERGLLNMTSIPIYKVLNVSAAYSGSSSIFELSAYSEIIATDLLFQYLGQIIKNVENAASSQKFGNEEDLAAFKDSISKAKKSLSDKELKKDRKVETLMTLVNRTTMIEQLLASKLNTSFSDTLKWSNAFK